ncbi:MAG: APC family permease [Chloroflexi bacterium]|nr:APC family permease [Chloroflexota bacterium]
MQPRGRVGRVLGALKQALIGEPLATERLVHERLTKVKALAVLSSDALSSSAYATEEILRVLVLAGAAALSLTLPIAFAIALLLVIVATSYRQTIKAYPQGGGSYIVTKDNLGTWPSLVAGSALLIDYVLTVAVSISAGVAAITSALPELGPYAVELAVAFIVLITLVNLRGVRESGTIFALPTYLFIGMAFLMVGLGLARLATEGPADLSAAAGHLPVQEPLTLFLVLRAFASGNAALTGTEAISDGVPAFQPPEWKNARITLTWMAGILGVLFLGISVLALQFAVLPSEQETVVSQLGRLAFGGDSVPYYVFQAATMLILVLAANTSFSDFPRLSYFLARDHFLPYQFQFRGDRLAFSTGILALGLLSGLLVVAFRADTHALIPLYAVGVFVSFTLSQASMVVRWWRRREPGWQHGLPINAVGAVTTGLVAIIIAATKFEHGAWMVIVLLPILVLMLRGINAYYVGVADQLILEPTSKPRLPSPPIVVVPVQGLDRAVARTLAFARSLSERVVAVHVTDDAAAGEALRARWESWSGDVPLVILESPYRALVPPLLAYLDALQQQDPQAPITVVLSEVVPRHFWEYLLQGQVALRLKAALFFRPNTVVVDMPYHLGE